MILQWFKVLGHFKIGGPSARFARCRQLPAASARQTREPKIHQNPRFCLSTSNSHNSQLRRSCELTEMQEFGTDSSYESDWLWTEKKNKKKQKKTPKNFKKRLKNCVNQLVMASKDEKKIPRRL